MWLIFALLSAVTFGVRGIIYVWTARQPINRNMMLCGVYSAGAVILLTASFVVRSEWSVSTLIGVLMGVTSVSATVSMYQGFAVGKASIVAVLTGLPAVVVTLFAYLFWDEILSSWQFIALAVIICGVLLINLRSDFSFRNMQGAGWGLLSMFFYAVTDLFAKQAMRVQADAFVTLFFMFITGALIFALIIRLSHKKAARQPEAPTIRGAWNGRTTLKWGLLIGFLHASGMILLMKAFELGVTGLVSAVVALNVLFMLSYSRVFLKEQLAVKEWAGIAMAISGIILLGILS